MLNDKFEGELGRKLPKPLYFLSSKESYFLDEALSRSVVSVISAQEKDFNFDVFNSSSSPMEIMDAASTLPFMAARRLVILKDFHQLSAAQVKALTPYFMKPCETTCMIILSQKDPKASIEAKWSVFTFRIRESDISLWLKKKAQAEGVKFSGSAIDHLIELVGPDIGQLASEMEKFKQSGLKTIGVDDIVSSTGISREYTSFNLIDALIAGNKTEAFRILRRLNEGKSFDATGILGPLNWHYRQFYSLWENKGKRPPKMNSTTYRTLMRYVPTLTQDEFYNIFKVLHEADLGIKTSGRPELVLDILLIKLLQIGQGN